LTDSRLSEAEKSGSKMHREAEHGAGVKGFTANEYRFMTGEN